MLSNLVNYFGIKNDVKVKKGICREATTPKKLNKLLSLKNIFELPIYFVTHRQVDQIFTIISKRVRSIIASEILKL